MTPAFPAARSGSPRWHTLLADGWADVEIPAHPSADDLVTSALASALKGDVDGARRAAARANCAADVERGAMIGADFARAVAWLGQGDCSAAFETLSPHFALAPDRFAVHHLAAVVGVFAEAAVRSNSTAAARAMLSKWMQVLTAEAGYPRHELELATALLCDTNPEPRIRRALLNAAGSVPATTARLHLALGMVLRRRRRPRESRPHLMVAEELLRESGASAWIGLAQQELRASGSRDGSQQKHELLSPQEKAITELASQGLTNRDIGERLFLSPRTVSSHLYNAFPKLGVTSRRELSASRF